MKAGIVMTRNKRQKIQNKTKNNWIKIIGSLAIIILLLFEGNELLGSNKIDIDDIKNTETHTTLSETTLVNGTFQIHYIDVGQGDATLIICNDKAMLIDAGENDQGTKIQNYLQKQGITKLDYVIGTHPDSDHIGGLDVVIYKFDCGTILLPGYQKDTKTYDDVINTMENKNYRNTLPNVGDTYQFSDASFTIIAPNNYLYGDTTNNYSIGIILKYGDTSFLFTGDAENEAEEDIVANGIDISADVYQVGHHGSYSSSTELLLNAVKPENAVISCGEGNKYGHPNAEVLNHFRERGIKVFRTDEQGTIIATSDGKNITFNCAPSDTWKSGN